MRFYVTLLLTAICIAVPAASLGLPTSATPMTPPRKVGVGMLVITSDSLDYCDRLLEKVRNALKRGVEQEVRIADSASYLFQRGGNLCSTGHIRRGIALERMALRKLLSS